VSDLLKPKSTCADEAVIGARSHCAPSDNSGLITKVRKIRVESFAHLRMFSEENANRPFNATASGYPLAAL
jgi:hypothetical protein